MRVDLKMTVRSGASGRELSNKWWVSGMGSGFCRRRCCQAPTNTEFLWIQIPEKLNMCLTPRHQLREICFYTISLNSHATAPRFFGKYSITKWRHIRWCDLANTVWLIQARRRSLSLKTHISLIKIRILWDFVGTRQHTLDICINLHSRVITGNWN